MNHVEHIRRIAGKKGPLPCFFFVLTVLLFPAESPGETQFIDVTDQAGLVDAGNERGIAWGDFDNDGDPDLFVAVLNGQDRLFRNEGDKTFLDVTVAAGLQDSTVSTAPAWCDHDGDGDLDLFVARVGANSLYRNEGDGTFTDVAATAGVAGTDVSWGVAWGDCDKNGTVDLYVVNFGHNPNRLFSNQGDGTFADVATASQVADAGHGLSASWADFDNDGDQDFYVANKDGANRLFRNDGQGVFTDIAGPSAIQDTHDSVGTAWGDCDNDGDIDLFLSSNQAPNRLFLNQGDGSFAPSPESAGLDQSGFNRGHGWADYDHDGDLDLYLARSVGDNVLYRNEGQAVFTDVTEGSGAADTTSGTAVAWADYDNDGDLDLFLSNFGSPMRLFENRQDPSRHWLKVRLESEDQNTRAVGARVQVHAGTRVWVRENNPGGGYQAQSPHQLHFGLDNQAQVDSLVVRWPSGEVDRFGPFASDQLLVLRRP